MTEWMGITAMKINKIGYLIAEGFKSIFTHGFMSFASVTIITACLVIMGSFAMLSLNIDKTIDALEEENDITAFIDETWTVEQAQAVEEQLLAIPNITEVIFESREEAFDNFISDYQEAYFDDIDSDVLRHRYKITIADITLMEDTRTAIMDIEGVAKVNAYIEVAQMFIAIRNVVSVISMLIVVVLAIVSVFIMSNTIKLATFGRREEIAIMKMVGATNMFIRLPFIIEGLFLGVTGAIIAFFAEWGLYTFVTENVLSGFVAGIVQVIPFESLMYPVLGAFIGVGVVVGTFGGVNAIRNYLKV